MLKTIPDQYQEIRDAVAFHPAASNPRPPLIRGAPPPTPGVWRRTAAAARLPGVVHFVGLTTKNGPNSPEVFSSTQPLAAVEGPVVQFRV